MMDIKTALRLMREAHEWPRGGQDFATPESGLPARVVRQERAAKALLQSLGLWEDAASSIGVFPR